ncbi:MAG: hypothetical protein ACI4DW_03020, partial [Lachnospiraceae bacterium]
MKKTGYLLTVLATVFVLAACGNKAENQSADMVTNETMVAVQEDVTEEQNVEELPESLSGAQENAAEVQMIVNTSLEAAENAVANTTV